MIQTASSKPKSGKREPRTSKKPRLSEPVPVPELVDERCSLVEPIVCQPVEETKETETLIDLPVEESKCEESPDGSCGSQLSEAALVEKTVCPCGSIIATKSLSKHEKTKKHLAWLSAQEITVVI